MAKIIQLQSITPQPIYINDFDRANDKGVIRGSVSIVSGGVEKGRTEIGDGGIKVKDKGKNTRVIVGKIKNE